MFLKKDNLVLGLVLGFLAPSLGILCFYLANSSSMSFLEFLQFLVSNKSFFTSILTVSLLADGTLFTIYINTERDHTARGIFIATLIYGILSLVLKYVL